MRFNKDRFNIGKFNTSNYLTITFASFFAGEGEVHSKAIVEIDVKGGLQGTSVLQAATIRELISEVIIEGAGQLKSKGDRLLDATISITGEGYMRATIGVDGIEIAQVFINGSGDIRSFAQATLNTIAEVDGAAKLSVVPEKISMIKASVDGSGDILADLELVISAKLKFEGEGNLNAKAINVISVNGEIEGSSDMEAYASRVFDMMAALEGSSIISSDSELVVVIKSVINGKGDILVNTQTQYKLSYIQYPTRALVVDNRTKVVIL